MPLWPILLGTIVLAITGCNSPGTAVDTQSDAGPSLERLRQDVTYLASDALEGRGIGTTGLDRAADYIAGQFAAAGLVPPPGSRDMFHRFDLTSVTGISRDTTLTANDTPLRLNRDFTALGFSGEGNFSGEAVFAGYAISESRYDDFANVDVRGKVVLAMRFEPHKPDGDSRLADGDWSPAARLQTKARAAAERGAVAILLVTPPRYHGPDELLPLSSQFAETPIDIPILHVTQDIANQWLTRANQPDLRTLQTQIDTTFRPASAALPGVRVSGTVRVDRTRTNLRNVVAVLPGAGPRAHEMIVIGAHYDHLGRGGESSLARGSSEIHNGADDNASGTAAMIEVARVLAKDKPLERSIVFVAFTAEEIGLVGSMRFVNHPPVDLKHVIAMINMDMVGRLRNDTLLIGGRDTAAALDAIVQDADDASPIVVKPFGHGGIGPSDHTSFAMQRIPVLFLFTGVHSDYHRPSDDAHKVNYQGLRLIVDFAAQITRAMAKVDRPTYIATADVTPRQSTTSPSAGRVRFGVVPDYVAEEGLSGLRIAGTVPGSPAEQAGLKSGDILTRFGEKPIRNIYDLTDALAAARPGQVVAVELIRAGSTLQLRATLEERH